MTQGREWIWKGLRSSRRYTRKVCHHYFLSITLSLSKLKGGIYKSENHSLIVLQFLELRSWDAGPSKAGKKRVRLLSFARNKFGMPRIAPDVKRVHSPRSPVQPPKRAHIPESREDSSSPDIVQHPTSPAVVRSHSASSLPGFSERGERGKGQQSVTPETKKANPSRKGKGISRHLATSPFRLVHHVFMKTAFLRTLPFPRPFTSDLSILSPRSPLSYAPKAAHTP